MPRKRKPGRPKSPNARRRMVSFKVTTEELRHLEAMHRGARARQPGLTFSEFLRLACGLPPSG